MDPQLILSQIFADVCVMDAPLGVRLKIYADALREQSSAFADAYDELVARLASTDAGRQAPGVGDILPDFLLPSKAGKLVSLASLLATGPVVVSFNRGHWCRFCRIELATLAEHHAEITSHGAQVVSIMPELQKFAAQVDPKTALAMRLLTDVDNGYAMSLGLVVWLGEEVKLLMQNSGYHLEFYQGNDGWFVPLPATFVVGRDGRIVARFVDPDFRRRMEIEEILKAIAMAD